MSHAFIRTSAAVASTAAALVVLSACGSEPSCGSGYESPETSISAILSAARMDQPELACASLPKNSTAEQIAAEVEQYKDFASVSETSDIVVTDQMGRGYTFDVSVGDETRQFEVNSETRGRWFWKSEVYLVSPQTYDLALEVEPSPSSTFDLTPEGDPTPSETAN